MTHKSWFMSQLIKLQSLCYLTKPPNIPPTPSILGYTLWSLTSVTDSLRQRGLPTNLLLPTPYSLTGTMRQPFDPLSLCSPMGSHSVCWTVVNNSCASPCPFSAPSDSKRAAHTVEWRRGTSTSFTGSFAVSVKCLFVCGWKGKWMKRAGKNKWASAVVGVPRWRRERGLPFFSILTDRLA